MSAKNLPSESAAACSPPVNPHAHAKLSAAARVPELRPACPNALCSVHRRVVSAGDNPGWDNSP